MTKFTPGPWSRDKYGSVIGSNGRDVLFRNLTILSTGKEERLREAEANTDLIAASPDLLSIAKRWAALDGGSWHPDRHASEKAELLADTAAAIAKATGEQP